MGFFENLKEKKKEKRIDQLEQDLNVLSNRIKFDPTKIVGVTNLFDNNENFTQRLQELKILASGNREQIKAYYQGCGIKNKSDYFWVNNPGTYMAVHAGIPRMTCQKMQALLTKAGIDIDIQVNNEAGEIDQKASDTANRSWKKIEEETNFIKSIGQMAFTDAMAGHDIVKLSYDLNASQYPIIEVYDPSEAEVLKLRNVTKAIIFKHYFTRASNKKKLLYRLNETYTTNALNEPIIKYQLYKLQDDGNEIQVDLETLNETAGLAIETTNRHRVVGQEQTIIQEFKGMQGMLAFDKPNKLPNMEFPHSVYGASDIAASDISDKIDEIFSEIASEVRNNKTISYIPDTMLDSNGQVNPFITRYTKIKGDQDQDGNNRVTTDIIPDKTDYHIKKAMIYLDFWCANCGLSPLSLGIATFDSVGANVSGDGLRERIKATLDTRNAKIEMFKPYLQKIIRQMISLNTWVIANVGAKQNNNNMVDIDFENTNININFGEYVGDTEAALVQRLSTAKTAGLMSLETCVDLLHPDWTDAQKQLEVNRLKIESNIGLESPDLLGITEPTIEETLTEEEKETEQQETTEEPRQEGAEEQGA